MFAPETDGAENSPEAIDIAEWAATKPKSEALENLVASYREAGIFRMPKVQLEDDLVFFENA